MEEHLVTHKRGCEVLARFGTNPYGQPMYRLVRADSRRQWSVGEFRPKYPKYGTSYIIERWCAPDKYGSQDEWEAAKDTDGVSYLGPFPSRGDYEFVLPLWDGDGNPISEPGEHHLVVMARIMEKSLNLTRSERWTQIEQAKETTKEARLKVLNDMIADARPLRGGDAERKYAEDADELMKKVKVFPQQKMPLGASLGTGE